MELKDTIDLMNSANYKERFVAEYLQLYIRCEKLNNYCSRIEAAELTGGEAPRHDCPLELLKQQLRNMQNYLHDLEVRASIEKINLRYFISRLPIDTTGGERKPVYTDDLEPAVHIAAKED